ncbi:MAG: hypothetical protein AUH43_04590 [Acidobacteria bacterium 13_1_40CM_65_14]|nr:MAG: hypothetical protein AUH43_04590 [Acidobacteria bacterium 13_1_40CM_65_14]OLC74422.1 MAG: hypothetical protein AUH72_21770 [Acidobacteria bacterium 13_1_40CM_4_65_8]OLE78393.1 MAG: hypothetical protein AUF76_19190 [Acidobacteria bacterium 13_1_20CM_2_65_9]
MVHAIALAVALHLSNAASVPVPTIAKAQAEVVRVYRDIGVDVEWSQPGVLRGDQPQSIHVVVIPYETGDLQQRPKTVMGAATRTPHGTRVAYVFYRRVEAEAAQYDVSPAFVLACAIAHEVGHLLLPDGFQSGHSRAGLMRACWDRDDFRRADMGQLRFLPEQALLIRARLTP